MKSLHFLLLLLAIPSVNAQEEDNGVPIRKYLKAAQMKRIGTKPLKRLLKDEAYNDKGDIKLLVDYYQNAHRQLNSTIFNDSDADVDSSSNRAGLYDAIIIGAGWAGMSAAMTLKSKGINNIKVLEAKDYIGGRSYTTYQTFNGEDIPVDFGSMWLHGGVDNPLYDVARAVGGIDTSVSTFAERMFKKNGGGAYTSQQLTSFYNELFEGQNGFMRYQARRQESTNSDQPLQTSANMYVNSLSSTEKKDVAKYFMTSYIELEYSGPMTEMSLWWWDMDEYVGNSDDLFLPGGYSSLIQKYAAPVADKVELEAVVKTINYKQANVKVTYTKNGVSTTLTTKKVIVTVPLGVLQANSIQFVPNLPLSRRNSISKLGMGRMNKIFMFWNPTDVFWDSNIEFFGDVTERDVDFQFFNPSMHNGGKPMLFAFFAGDYAEQIEGQSGYEDTITDLAMAALRNMYGNQIPDPEKVAVTSWNKDPYIKGAYSFNKVGMPKLARKTLAVPIKRQRLFISGEATHYEYFQTTHGAYLAGKTAAQKVANSL